MVDLLILAGYIGAAIFAFRKAYLLMDDDIELVDPMDKAMGCFVGLIVGAMWPLVAVGYLLYRFAKPTTPRERREALQRREDEVAEREREIRRLERELGIKP